MVAMVGRRDDLPMTITQSYMLDHTWVDEPRRLELLEQLHDPSTARRLDHAGIAAGDRCLEVGAGRGSVARLLARRTGPNGSVLAIDLQTDLLGDLDEPNVEVLAADVLELELPPASLDLIHTRALLMHIPERRRALERMVDWLAPGGRLVVEEPVWLGSLAADPAWSAVTCAYEQAAVSMDWWCGREIVTELSEAGIDGVHADAELDVIRGGSAVADWYRLSMAALRPAVLAAGTATEEQIDEQVTRLADPGFVALGFTWIGAWGRRP